MMGIGGAPDSRAPIPQASASGRRLDVTIVVVLFVGALVCFRAYADDIAGGSDSYGYVSEAVRLTQGHLYEPERVFSPFGLPENSYWTHPLGYAPKGGDGTVPTYPFGYPLLMAAAISLAGLPAAFWVTPILGAGTVALTYLVARYWLGRVGGLLAAALTFLLPNFLWGAAQPLSDVVAAFFATLALAVLFHSRPRAWTDVLLGTAVGCGVWVRPNMGLLAVPVAACLLWERRWWRLARFGAVFVPFLIVEGLANQYLFGAPTLSGYGNLPMAPSLADAGARAVRHLLRLHDQQAGVGLALVALGLALGRLSLRHRAILLGIGIAFLAFFAFYAIDDAWWYGRFLVPALPAVAILEASGIARLVGPGRLRLLRSIALAVGLAAFTWASVTYAQTHGVFDVASAEARYVRSADLARSDVQGQAVVLAMQHGGSLRFYTGLPTARYDLAPIADLVTTLYRVEQAGGSVYLLAEGQELKRIRESQRAILLEGAQDPGQVEPWQVKLLRLHLPLVPEDIGIEHPTQAALGKEFALRGFDVSAARVHPSEKLVVTLYWQALAVPDRDYSVTVQLLDEEGKLLTQSDSYPVEGKYPTSWWRPGYVVKDTHQLVVPSGSGARTLTMIAGLYSLQTMERLPVRNTAGAVVGDHVVLDTIGVSGD